MEKTRIEILRPTTCDKVSVAVGAVIDASPADARTLIDIGKARETDKKIGPAPTEKKAGK